MGSKYMIHASRYPYPGYYEVNFQCNTFWRAIWQLLRYRHQGYNIIDFQCRDIKVHETFTWAGDK